VNKKLLIDIIGIILLALVVVVGYKLSPLLLPKADITVQPQAGCDLQKSPCEAALPGGGTVRLSITPRPIPMVAPLQLEVALAGRSASKVEVDFAGVNMNMGLNRPQLKALGDGRFSGEGTLPVCVTGSMDWQATLLLETDRERIAVPFRFAHRQE
jgi:hypothetical protein